MIRTPLLAATFITALTGLAQAQPVSGLYIGAGGGANFLQRERVDSLRINGQTLISNERIGYKTGFVGVGSLGYGFGNGLRLEIEGDYRRNESGRNTPGGFASGTVREQKYGGMVNALFDLDVGSPYVFPYIGAGVGYSAVSVKTPLIQNQSDSSFAYQAIAGLSFPIPPVVGLSLTAEYRYFALAGTRDFSFSPASNTRASYKLTENYNHSLMLGLRYAFNVSPPVVDAPAPVSTVRSEARTYLVFFDWDRADLTARAKQIVAEAAQATTRVAVTRIEVAGHTDASGTARYNEGLSQRRANVVAAELVRLGVPRAAITTQAFGLTRPLVPTAAGVREPQNRRVEIILR